MCLFHQTIWPSRPKTRHTTDWGFFGEQPELFRKWAVWLSPTAQLRKMFIVSELVLGLTGIFAEDGRSLASDFGTKSATAVCVARRSPVQPGAGGTANTHTTAPSTENPKLPEVLSSKPAVRQNIFLHASPTAKNICRCDFCRPGSFSFILFPKSSSNVIDARSWITVNKTFPHDVIKCTSPELLSVM